MTNKFSVFEARKDPNTHTVSYFPLEKVVEFELKLTPSGGFSNKNEIIKAVFALYGFEKWMEYFNLAKEKESPDNIIVSYREHIWWKLVKKVAKKKAKAK